TRDERYARAARAYIEDWLREDPYATATTARSGDNMLTLSIRLGSSMTPGWGGALAVFLDSPTFDDAFVKRVLDSMERQADYLARHLTAYGNFRIAQLDSLVLTALRFPFLPGAGRMLETGISGMRNALATQFLPDGVHIERTPSYAGWMTNVIANYLLLPKIDPAADAHADPRMLVRALDYGAQSELFGVNDASAAYRDPEAFSRLRSRAEMIRRLGLEAPAEPPLDQSFPYAGQVFSRTSWSPGADYLAFDASTWGGGHGHLSRLSLVLRSGGRALVADPGILTYEMSDPFGPYGKSTEAHSTLNVNGGNQSGADARLLRADFTRHAALIQARYQGGYWSGRYGWSFGQGRGAGAWGDHERIVLWIKGEYALVIDSMAADPGAEIRNVWQLGPMDKWSQDPARLAWWSENSDVNLALEMIVPPPKTSMRIYDGQREPLRGWLGVRGAEHIPAPQVEFRYPSARSAVTSVVLLAPYKAARPRFEPRYGTRNSIHHLEIGPDHFAWSTGLLLPVDDGQPFFTNAVFVWQRKGSPEKGLLAGGTYLRVLPLQAPAIARE
ncbi:MAG: heparinase II/III family protein, partial [Bryobacteraceae bacterium]